MKMRIFLPRFKRGVFFVFSAAMILGGLAFVQSCKRAQEPSLDSLKATLLVHEENMKVLNQQMTELNQRFHVLANAVEDHRVRVLELEKRRGRAQGR